MDSVKRMIVTSPCAAIYCDNINCTRAPNGCLDESDWNTSSSTEHIACSYSKMLTEKVAWKIAEAHGHRKLMVIHPSLVRCQRTVGEYVQPLGIAVDPEAALIGMFPLSRNRPQIFRSCRAIDGMPLMSSAAIAVCVTANHTKSAKVHLP